MHPHAVLASGCRMLCRPFESATMTQTLRPSVFALFEAPTSVR
jgi:hypothetical protein